MKRLLSGLLVLAVLLSACAGGGSGFAAKVDDIVITKKVIDDEIDAVVRNEFSRDYYNQQLKESGGLEPSKGKINEQYVANVVFTRILSRLLERERQRTGVTPTTAQRTAAEQKLRDDSQIGADFDKFPFAYRTYLIDRQADLQAVLEARSAPEKVDAYYAAHSADSTKNCVRHVLTPTVEDARAAKARIDGGEDFAKVANEFQEKSGEKQDGGDQGCPTTSELDRFVAPFAAEVKRLQPGEVSPPVKTQFGWHIIQLTSRQDPPEAEAKTQIKDDLSSPSNLLGDLFSGAKIEVDPEYGDYVPPPEGSKTPGQVVPHGTRSGDLAPSPSGADAPVASQP